MRYLSPRFPDLHRVVVVESASRRVSEAALPRLLAAFPPHIRFDLVTCHAGLPAAFDSTATVWRTEDHHSPDARTRLLREIQATNANALAIFCSSEPIMTRWKWWLAFRLRCKILIVNENGDCFWLDSANLRNIRRLVAVRTGLSGGSTAQTLSRAAAFPFILAYLLLYAAVVHTRRATRRLFVTRQT